MFYFTWGDNTSLKSHRRPNKIPSIRHEKPAFELFVRKVPDTLKTKNAVAIALGYHLELDIKFPSLETLRTFDKELREFDLELT